MPESRIKLRVAMFPWLAFGHIIPFLVLAKKIAQKGHTVYFISTLGNIKRLPKIPPSLSTSINLVQLSLPQVENLPQNAEATMDVPYHKIPFLKKAYDKLQEPLSHFLESQVPDWIIYDFAPHWLPPIASKLGISCAYFSILNASSMSFIGPTDTQVSTAYGVRTEPEDFTVPPKWVPSSFSKQVRFRLFEAKKIVDNIRENDSGVSDRVRVKSSTEGCHVYLIRSCEEVESEWLNLLPELHRKPVVPVGLLPPSVQDGGDEEKDGAWNTVNQWLSNHEKGTVVYVALGSEIRPSQEDFNELALGLELSGLPFFWALRRSNGVEGGDQVQLPDGFEERTKEPKGRGVVWTSWAPQLKILAHESVGGFLTHCGWSSTIEGLLFGRPLIMLPYLIDQGLNARFYDKEVGVEVPRNENDGSFTRDSVAESLRLVVVEEEGKSYREKAKNMSETFGDEDLHDRYVEKCIKYLEIKRRI